MAATPDIGISPRKLHERRERVFLILAGIFLGTLAMLNILGISRFLVLAGIDAAEGADALVWYNPATWSLQWGSPGAWTFAVAVGVLPYPMTFLCTDVISEFYGRRRANFVVFVGLLLNLWVVFILWAGGRLPGFWPIDPAVGMPDREAADWAFFHIRKLTFGAVTASMIAYMAAQFCDVFLFHFWKRVTRGKHLWLRNNGSTMVSQIVDTVAVILITHFYARALPIDDAAALWPQLLAFILTGYVFKFTMALLDTPLIYAIVPLLSRYLKIDPHAEHTADAEAVLVAMPMGREQFHASDRQQ
jgi:queuosine precursor transporter